MPVHPKRRLSRRIPVDRVAVVGGDDGRKEVEKKENESVNMRRPPGLHEILRECFERFRGGWNGSRIEQSLEVALQTKR